MKAGTNFCKLPGKYGYKWPSLSELHQKAFGQDFTEQHNAKADTKACADSFFKMLDMKAINLL